MDDIFLQLFSENFRLCFNRDIEKLLENFKKETIYVCAFVTDSDFGSLYLAINTVESLSRHIEKMKKEGLCHSIEDENYYRWGCSEFQYEYDFDHGKISQLLFNHEKNTDFQNGFTEKIAEILKKTDTDIFQYFGQDKSKITFFVSMTDDDRDLDIENQSAKIMNSETLFESFLNRYK